MVIVRSSPSASKTDTSTTTVPPSGTVTSSIGSIVGAELGGASTVTISVSLEVNSPSEAVSSSTYTPTELKVAVVERALALPNVTSPGPTCLFQVWVSTLPSGFPSSVTEPSSTAGPG